MGDESKAEQTKAEKSREKQSSAKKGTEKMRRIVVGKSRVVKSRVEKSRVVYFWRMSRTKAQKLHFQIFKLELAGHLAREFRFHIFNLHSHIIKFSFLVSGENFVFIIKHASADGWVMPAVRRLRHGLASFLDHGPFTCACN